MFNDTESLSNIELLIYMYIERMLLTKIVFSVPISLKFTRAHCCLLRVCLCGCFLCYRNALTNAHGRLFE